MCFLTGLRIYSFTHLRFNGISDPNELNVLKQNNQMNQINQMNQKN